MGAQIVPTAFSGTGFCTLCANMFVQACQEMRTWIQAGVLCAVARNPCEASSGPSCNASPEGAPLAEGRPLGVRGVLGQSAGPRALLSVLTLAGCPSAQPIHSPPTRTRRTDARAGHSACAMRVYTPRIHCVRTLCVYTLRIHWSPDRQKHNISATLVVVGGRRCGKPNGPKYARRSVGTLCPYARRSPLHCLTTLAPCTRARPLYNTLRPYTLCVHSRSGLTLSAYTPRPQARQCGPLALRLAAARCHATPSACIAPVCVSMCRQCSGMRPDLFVCVCVVRNACVDISSTIVLCNAIQ